MLRGFLFQLEAWIYFKSVEKKFNMFDFWFGDHRDRLFSFTAIKKVTILKYMSEVAKGLKRRKITGFCI